MTFARLHRQEVAKPGLEIPGKGNTVGSLGLQLNVTKGIVWNEDGINFLPRNVFNFTLGLAIHLIVENTYRQGAVIQSEASQKEKNKYHVLRHICEIQKNDTDKPICRAGIKMQTLRANAWMPRRERWGGMNWGDGMNWEIGIDIHTMYKIAD